MSSDRLRLPSTKTLCHLTAGLSILTPLPALAQSGCDSTPETITLTGLCRDLREQGTNGGHVDFEVTIPTGTALYTGNVDYYTHDDKPEFKGGGNKVLIQATDSKGRPIAPHLANKRFEPPATLQPQATTAILQDNSGKDAFEISFISAEFNEDGTSTWIYHVEELTNGKDLSHWVLGLDPSHVVMAGTTPGYDLGVDASTGFYGIKWDVTDEFSSQDFTIVLDQHYLGDDATCSILAKAAGQPDTGDLFAPTATVSTTGTPYQSTGGGLVDEATFGDSPATLGVVSNGGIDSPWSFRSWYRDTPPLNMSTMVSIDLTRQSDCTYSFDAAVHPDYASLGGFFPIDDQLLGNSGGSPDHNFHFTFEVHATFTYDASDGQYLRFEGDDDVWVFVDGKLAIDLGGIHSPMEQFADMDRMGLIDGETYTIDMFFAERHRTQSNFNIETNFVLEGITPTMVSAIFD